MGPHVPVVEARAAEDAGVAGCAESIACHADAIAHAEPSAALSRVPQHSWFANARIRVEAFVHSARGVAQAPAARLDWQSGECNARDRAVHQRRVAGHACTARVIALKEVVLLTNTVVDGGTTFQCCRELNQVVALCAG